MEEKRLLRIIEEAIGGSNDAFIELMNAKSKDVFYIASSLMKNKHDGEDAAQDAIVLIKQNIGRLQSAEAFNVWMYRIVNSVCMNMQKRRGRITVDSPVELESAAVYEERQEFLPEEYLASGEKREQLLEAIVRLPDKFKRCLLLYYYEEMSYVQIAATLDIKPQDVANNLNRAKKKIKRMMDQAEAQKQTGATAKGVAVAPLPVLTQVLHDDATRAYTPDVAARMMQVIEAPGTKALMITAGSAATSSLLGKVGAAVVAAAVVVFSVGAVISGGTAPVGDVPSLEAELTDAKALQATEVLGEGSAKELHWYAQNGTDNRSWAGYVRSNQLVFKGSAHTVDYAYSVYTIVKEGKHVVMIERSDSSGSVAVAYSIEATELPQEKGIIDAFNAWK